MSTPAVFAVAVPTPVRLSGPAPPPPIPTRAQILADIPVPAAYTIADLQRETTHPGSLPNPNRSPGCSPILRAILEIANLDYLVTRERANDGDLNSHLAGNALDVTADPDPYVLRTFLRTVPQLFAAALCYDPLYPTSSLYVWNGALSNLASFGGLGSPAITAYTGVVHLSSSFGRLAEALKLPAVIAALHGGTQ